MKLRTRKKHFNQLIKENAKKYDTMFTHLGNKRNKHELFNGFRRIYKKA